MRLIPLGVILFFLGMCGLTYLMHWVEDREIDKRRKPSESGEGK